MFYKQNSYRPAPVPPVYHSGLVILTIRLRLLTDGGEEGSAGTPRVRDILGKIIKTEDTSVIGSENPKIWAQ